jgi:hypothetical protein
MLLHVAQDNIQLLDAKRRFRATTTSPSQTFADAPALST